MELTVYLAGQIHDDWRQQVRDEARTRELPIHFVGPQDDHTRSDNIGEEILGEAMPNARWKDEVASQANNLRTRVLLQRSDVVIALFGEKYRQWNVAMDAALAMEMNKPVIVVRAPELHHALKELGQRAQMMVETPQQAVAALAYIFEGLD